MPNIKTATLTGKETKIDFDTNYQYFWAQNLSDSDMYMSVSPNIVPDADGVMLVPAKSGRSTGDVGQCKTLYILGNGKVEITAQYADVCPFHKAAKGGEKKSISAAMGYVSEGLMCHYSVDSAHFTEGWRIDDLSGNNNVGLFFAQTISGNSNKNQPSYLYSAGNYINLNQKYIIMPQMDYDNITLDAVCKFPNTPSEEVDIISNLEAGGYCIYYDKNTATLRPYVRVAGSYRTTQGFSNDKHIHLFTATYDNQSVKFYIDGILIGETEIEGSIEFPNADTVLAINANPYGGNAQENYLGVGSFNFYSARVYNRALSADEIMQNFLIDQSLFWEN